MDDTVSPTHDGLANSTKYMAWWLSMYNTACSIAIQKLPHARVRQLVKLDTIAPALLPEIDHRGFRWVSFGNTSPD